MRYSLILLLLLLSGRQDPCLAESRSLQPNADTTLIGIAPNNNLGTAEFFNAGFNGRGYESRALISFDLRSIAPGSTINQSTLTLDVIRQPAENPTDSYFAFYRMLRPWGEGTKTYPGMSPGMGSPATLGDATWNDRFYGMSLPWAAPGGAIGIDFASSLTAEAAIGGIFESPYTLPSDSGLATDLQFWVDHPDQNFGWMVLTESTGFLNTARAFASREDGLGRGPLLDMDYTPVPEPSILFLLFMGVPAMFGLIRFRRR
jgi:hypothetical protein